MAAHVRATVQAATILAKLDPRSGALKGFSPEFLRAVADTLRELSAADEAIRHWVEAEVAAVGYDWTTAEGAARLNVLQSARNEAFALCERTKS